MLRALGIVDKWSRGMEFILGVWQPCNWWLVIFWVEQDWLTTSTPKLDDVPIIQKKRKDANAEKGRNIWAFVEGRE